VGSALIRPVPTAPPASHEALKAETGRARWCNRSRRASCTAADRF
jgi:hypothetical protein